jgi:peptidase M41-like protein/AAA+ lid domain-containing protein/ATPase family protein associated with various cellular activities (AAA)
MRTYQTGPRGQAPAVTWRHWLLPLGAAADGVVILAATNRPDALDPALRRTGRFDREVLVPLPSRADRQAILTVHARGKNLEPDVDLGQVDAATPGFSGADLANLVNEAALTAVRAGRTGLISADFAGARDRVMLGTRDHSATLTLDELATVAVHEAGHALVATLSPRADPVSRVTILGAGRALGLTEQLPADDRRLYGETLPGRHLGRPARRNYELPESSSELSPLGSWAGVPAEPTAACSSPAPSGPCPFPCPSASTGMDSANARLANALALPSMPREEGAGTPFGSSAPGPGSSAGIFLASSTARFSSLTGRCTSMNSPFGSCLMMPDSKPCSSSSRSLRCRPRQTRFVMT